MQTDNTVPSYYFFKAYAQKERVMDAYELFVEIANSRDKETIENNTTRFFKLMEEITVKGEDMRMPLQQGTSFNHDEMNKDFLALILPRVESFLTINSDFKLALRIVQSLRTSIQLLFMEEDSEIYQMMLTQIVNFSRTLIQDVMAVERASKYLTYFPKKYCLTDKQQKKFTEAFSLFKTLLRTPLVRWALDKVLMQSDFQAVNEFKADETLRILGDMTVIWVKGALYFGMVGLDGIYLDEELFRLSKPEWTVPRIIGVCFHEGFHYAQRVLRHNFAAITPPSQDPKHLEDGCLFEHYLWGHYNIAYWMEGYGSSVSDATKWNKTESLFSEDEISKGNNRGIQSPNCNGLCADAKAKDEM